MSTSTQWKLSVLLSGLLAVWMTVSLGFGAGLYSAPQPQDAVKFGGTFDELKPEQQRLVRGWYKNFNQIMGQELDPKVAYGKLPYSSRTTFEAAKK